MARTIGQCLLFDSLPKRGILLILGAMPIEERGQMKIFSRGISDSAGEKTGIGCHLGKELRRSGLVILCGEESFFNILEKGFGFVILTSKELGQAQRTYQVCLLALYCWHFMAPLNLSFIK
ncbi:uncharacterized protein LOC110025792 [Phalaenopsis equestris]|uniref:uncharacterized protein LOC110025792 n=1 Tax=Phalaenopsis equestris TaxID=78828 RepID=UPI0009E347B2|nr:uncharacterized protein LOC110025792 [Phalaenopsis equestris]